MWLSVLRFGWRWFWRNWKRNAQRAGTTTAIVAFARHVLSGKPETIFRGSIEPGAGLQVRVLEPGER